MCRVIFLSLVLFFNVVSNLEVAQAKPDLLLSLKAEASLQLLAKDMGLKKSGSVVAQAVRSTSEDDFEYVDIELGNSRIGPIRLLLKGPKGFMSSSQRLDCLFIASGFFTGRDVVKLLKASSNVVLAGFEYPYSLDDFQKDPTTVLHFVHRTPAHIAATLQWLNEQTWVKPNGVTALGVSLGGVLMPTGLHLAKRIGTRLKGSIFAYTGAHLPPVLEANLKNHVPSQILGPAIHLVNNFSSLHDPKLHLPFLPGPFLVLRADRDQVFPLDSSLPVEQLLSEPKRIEVVSGTHIDATQTDLIFQTQSIIADWMLQLEGQNN